MAAFSADEIDTAIANRCGRGLVVATAAVHFFIILKMSTDFRNATKKLLGFRTEANSSSRSRNNSAVTLATVNPRPMT